MLATARSALASGRLAKLLSAATFGVLCVLLMAAPGRTTHGPAHDPELLPNLQTWDLSDGTSVTGIEFVVSETAQQLRFDNEVVNVTADTTSSRGPLEVFARRVAECGSGKDARQALQRIYYDSNGTGKFERKQDKISREVPVGCMIYHQSHSHWHFEHFAKYELYNCIGDPCTRDGAAESIGEKITFCIADVFRRNVTDDSPTSAYYGLGCGRQSVQGLSAGWGDQYTKSTSGQELSIVGLEPGTYCYVSTADPGGLLAERDETDNSQSIRLSLGDDDDADLALDTVAKGLAGC
jgi:hypothetical protein